ncbi:MAG TPA: substrate-binding domain-containing protein [Isosphaeraceae bacterium]
MRRWSMKLRLISVALLAGLAPAGCDTDSFAPPAPARSRTSSASSGAMPVRAKEIAMILPAGDNTDLMLYDQIGRNEAGFQKVVFRSLKPAPGAPPSKQAELIKQAAADGASALIVVPDSTKETADAIAALDPAKTPVLLLGRTPTGAVPPGATVVAFEPFEASAKKLVDAIAEDLKKQGSPADAAVALVVRSPADESSPQRDAALTEALKAAKLPIGVTIPVGTDLSETTKAVEAVLKAHPEVWAVVSDDEGGIQAGNSARRVAGGRKYLSAGYYIGHDTMTLTQGNVSAIAQRSLEVLVRRAVKLAVDRAKGQDTPARVVIPIEVQRGKLPLAPPAETPTNSPGEIDMKKVLTPPPGQPIDEKIPEAKKGP